VSERLEAGVLAQEVHPAHRSVQGMVHLLILCFPRGPRYREQATAERRPPSLLARPRFHSLRPRFRYLGLTPRSPDLTPLSSEEVHAQFLPIIGHTGQEIIGFYII
jgi:hypothetical protein